MNDVLCCEKCGNQITFQTEFSFKKYGYIFGNSFCFDCFKGVIEGYVSENEADVMSTIMDIAESDLIENKKEKINELIEYLIEKDLMVIKIDIFEANLVLGYYIRKFDSDDNKKYYLDFYEGNIEDNDFVNNKLEIEDTSEDFCSIEEVFKYILNDFRNIKREMEKELVSREKRLGALSEYFSNN